MPEILLYGATGHTGRLVAASLFRRGAKFGVAGRNHAELARVASSCGGPEVHVVKSGDITSLTDALTGCRVLLTTVGPFAEHGHVAVEAALRAGTHYVDACGEGSFIETLITRYAARAQRAGLVLAPAMGFDEIVAEVAATLATEGLAPADLVITYAAPGGASPGTIRSALGILAGPAPFIANARVVEVATGECSRWAPLPPPWGPKLALSAGMAELYLAPRHLELSSLQSYLAMERAQALALRGGLVALRALSSSPPVMRVLGDAAVRMSSRPPTGSMSGMWAVLAEARAGARWRNVAVTGSDVYGTTAELLATAAIALASEPLEVAGMLTPVEALGADFLHKVLIGLDVSVEVYQEGSL